MRINAMIYRIIRQFFRDKRTLALLVIAPLFIFTLINYVLVPRDVPLQIGVENSVLETLLQSLDGEHDLFVLTSDEANKKFEDSELDAYITMNQNQLMIMVEGTSTSKAQQVMQEVQTVLKKMAPQQNFTIEKSSYFGNDQMETFDYTAPIFIGFFIFFFVFLIAGVSFLRERTTGTLERLLASPIKRSEVVFGYLIGFGIFTVFQASIISAFSIYVLGVYSAGHFYEIIVVTLVISLTALSFGTFISAYANNELQMIQFIPLIVMPQAFFTGLFPIEGMAQPLQWLAKIMPLTYGAKALEDIMLRGSGLMSTLPNLLVLLGLTVLFALLNIVTLKKYRTW